MYPVSSVASSAASSGAPDNEDDRSNNEGALQQGANLQQAEVFPSPSITSTTATTMVKDGGEYFSQKHGTSVAVSSSATTIGKEVGSGGIGGSFSAQKSATVADSDVSGLLGVALSPESVLIIKDLFSKMDVFSRRTYKSMIGKQLPSNVSDRLTVTERAIWYFTYRLMCEDGFVSRCFGEYHHEYRPGFIRALPDIRVLSDFPEGNVVPLPRDRLSDFLSRLDCAVHNKVKSVFDSHWSEVSVTLEEGSLNSV
ncbi:hypothetical protein, partial [Candidatus Ichthyocystis sparus]|uniref:hypothetical protein n=1 Tax=Candidatus Ichthyocystis sparus TaxID=1561004 RepID=UPI0011468737